MTEPRSASKTASRHVSEILTVGLQRQGVVTAHRDPVEVVPAQRVARRPPGREREQEGRQRPRRDRDGGEEVQPFLEGGLRARLDRHCLQEAVGVDVGNEHEGGAAVALHLEHRLEPAATIEQHAGERPEEREVTGPLALRRAPSLVDPPHSLGVDPDARAEPEAASVDATGRDRAAFCSRASASASRSAAATGSRGSPSARGNTLVPPPGTKPIG